MVKQPRWLVILALFTSCTERNPNFIGQVEGAPFPATLDAGHSTRPDLDTPYPPSTVAPDAAGPLRPRPTPQPTPTRPAFGAICSESARCAADERCVYMEQQAQRGICLQRCRRLNQPCDLGDSPLMAGCADYYNPEGRVRVCAILCQLGEQRFPCPNDTDYRCKAYGAEFGACIPR